MNSYTKYSKDFKEQALAKIYNCRYENDSGYSGRFEHPVTSQKHG